MKSPAVFLGQRGFLRLGLFEAGGGLLLDLQLLLAVDAAVLATRAQLKDLVALLLDGGDAAGVAAADDVHQPAGRVGLFLLDGLALVDGGDGGVVREVLKHDSVENVVLCDIDEVGPSGSLFICASKDIPRQSFVSLASSFRTCLLSWMTLE